MARVFIATHVTCLLLAGSAWALPSATFEKNVFRVRAAPGESVRVLVHGPVADHFVAILREPVGFGPGCDLRDESLINNQGEPFELWCALDPATLEPAPLRYRFSFADGDDFGSGPPGMRGVVYSGPGADVAAGERVFGGPGRDYLNGILAYGGPGDDFVNGTEESARQHVLRGGAGDDDINGEGDSGPSRMYGGRGDDHLSGSYERDMIVGGAGHDVVDLTVDGKPDLVRLRGGGADRMTCGDLVSGFGGEPHDVAFADSTDRIDPNCKGMRVLFRSPPRR